ncbi:hypothetical protein NQZ68_031259 [Dissostichus eleginoides]|nr:hypothetical protein NQZ68_031259 [Dissostichus eleginoides]
MAAPACCRVMKKKDACLHHGCSCVLQSDEEEGCLCIMAAPACCRVMKKKDASLHHGCSCVLQSDEEEGCLSASWLLLRAAE